VAAAIATITANAAARGVELPPGASEDAIAAAEQALGFTLPEEVRAWYRAHDGGGDRYIANNRELLSLDRMVSEWKVWKDLLDQGVFEGNDHSSPGPGVQQKWWIPEWLPVTYDGAGNHDVIDLAPDIDGRVGQIVEFWHDDDDREVIAANLLEFLLDVEWAPSEF
jgi:cell wall assembly regulator SMI1